jgi:hypothetical protein
MSRRIPKTSDTEDLFLQLYELLRRGFGDGLEVEALIL